MEVRVEVPRPAPPPEPRISVYRHGPDRTHRYAHGDYWSLTVDEAREMHRKLGEALQDPRLET